MSGLIFHLFSFDVRAIESAASLACLVVFSCGCAFSVNRPAVAVGTGTQLLWSHGHGSCVSGFTAALKAQRSLCHLWCS